MPEYTNAAIQVMKEVSKAVIGKEDCIKKVMSAIIAGGHILIEDIPGVGKTTLALAFSKSMGMIQQRVQFTPDILPSDITGFTLYNKETDQFRYEPGPIMCNLFLADEINRTSPKTQSALLEVMEEGNVTVDKITRKVPDPFVVIATENPGGSAGTQQIPDSQLDRFMICITIGYPNIADEIKIVKDNQSGSPVDQVSPVITTEYLKAIQLETEQIFIHDRVFDYIGNLIEKTRNHPMIQIGISPRGTIALSKMSKACAFLEGRNYCIPSDVKEVFSVVAGHRISLNSKARVSHSTSDDIITDILNRTPVPSLRKQK